jgi:osmotically inducible protein OsmC
MPIREAEAVWNGTLQEGSGSMRVGSGAFEGSYSFGTRFEEAAGTNPEELIGAAHAGCYAMALAGALGRAGHPPTSVRTSARVHLDKGDAGWSITRIELDCEARVPGIAQDAFMNAAEETKTTCPISKALAAVPIDVSAKLLA